MKILSFDVGIKNLSFCLLNDTLIEDWGILNICTDNVCEHCSTDGKRCDKSAKFICGELPFLVMFHPSYCCSGIPFKYE